VQKENSHHELPRAANGSRPPFRLQGCFLTRRQAQDFHKKATPTVSRRKEVQHREALRHGHCHAEGFARRPAGFDGSAAVPEGQKKPMVAVAAGTALPREGLSPMLTHPAGWPRDSPTRKSPSARRSSPLSQCPLSSRPASLAAVCFFP